MSPDYVGFMMDQHETVHLECFIVSQVRALCHVLRTELNMHIK